jgi:hypothetical protein
MDPTDLLRKTALIIQKREKGETFHEAVLDAFAPPPPPETPAPAPPGSTLAPGSQFAPQGEAGPLPGQQAQGVPFGVAPGQAELGPGGRPDMQTLLASLGASGQPNVSAGVTRRLPA